MVLILRALTAILAALLLPLSVPAAVPPEIGALSAILMAEDGSVLYEREADRMLPMASTTKLMTALVAAERLDPAQSVTVTPDCCAVEGSSMYLRPDEAYTVRELLTGLLLASGNDAALALAGACAGDVEAFSVLMNETAAALGMKNTHFTNPHGLNEAGHYATARDLAILMRAVMQNALLAELLALPAAEIHGVFLPNHNKLLETLPGCLGGKTGYTAVAGRCLVSCAERDGTRLYCVTLHDPDDWNSHRRLYDWGFSQVKTLRVDAETLRYEISLLGGTDSCAVAVPAEEQSLLLPADSEPEYRVQLPFYVFAPTAAGAEAGLLEIRDGAETLLRVPLVYAENYPVQQVNNG